MSYKDDLSLVASEAITLQEKREQQKAVRGGRLPVKVNDTNVPLDLGTKIKDIYNMSYEDRYKIVQERNIAYTKEQYERMGIKLIDTYDDLFYSVELSDGWEIRNILTNIFLIGKIYTLTGKERRTSWTLKHILLLVIYL